jgi:hypothetical protein
LAVILDDLSVVRLVINTGGSFALGASAAVGANPQALTVADIDNDKDLDLALANRNSNTASVLVNAGNATFTVLTVASQLEPRGVAFGRINADVLLDLVITNHDSSSISVLTGNGSGFTPLATLSTGGTLRPDGVTLADVDNDGDDDIIAATSDDVAGSFASLYRTLPAGFGGMTNFATNGSNASTIVAADMNCDGLPDLAVVNQDSNNVSVMGNLGNGLFGAAVLHATGVRPGEIAATDLDGDADMDLAVANRDSNNVSVLINETCLPPIDADINNDGTVNIDDLLAVIGAWGACPAPPASCPGDIAPAGGGNGQVDIDDLLAVIALWS